MENDCVWSRSIKLQSPFFWASLKLHHYTVFWWGLQVFFCGAILGLSKSYWTTSILWSSSIGFTAVKNTDCLSLLRLLPPGIKALLALNVFHLHFRCDSCTRCLAMQDQRDFLLNVPEMLWNTRRVWKRVQAILEPFLWSSSFCQESYPSINYLTSAKYFQTLPWLLP